MKIHEYQGKEIFRKYGVPTPRGVPAFSVDEAMRAALQLVVVLNMAALAVSGIGLMCVVFGVIVA